MYTIFVDEIYVQHFYPSNQICLLIFGHFSEFLLICKFYFRQISPALLFRMNVSKDALNDFLFQRKKTVPEVQKTWYFLILYFGPQAIAPPLATLLENTMIVELYGNIHT